MVSADRGIAIREAARASETAELPSTAGPETYTAKMNRPTRRHILAGQIAARMYRNAAA